MGDIVFDLCHLLKWGCANLGVLGALWMGEIARWLSENR